MILLVTGGAGFIGSHMVRRLVLRYTNYTIVNLDALTYAGNLANLEDIAAKPNYSFVKGDIRDREVLSKLFKSHQFDGIIHLAAESHVDRSITDPSDFIQTNVQGTLNLLNAARDSWSGNFKGRRFFHISTDEVFGSLGETGFFNEQSPYHPNSPYAASKAASDHLVRAYGVTYGLPYLVSNCSNNFGPNQFPEKLLPLCINNIIQGRPLPIYGRGANTRDWLYVEDHVAALDTAFHEGRPMETYCIGGGNELRNIDLVRKLCALMDGKLGRKPGSSEKLITYVKDRPGHDLRYAIDDDKIKTELGWKPSYTFEQALERTVDWYLQNKDWLLQVTSGAYRKYYEKMYGQRSVTKKHKA